MFCFLWRPRGRHKNNEACESVSIAWPAERELSLPFPEKFVCCHCTSLMLTGLCSFTVMLPKKKKGSRSFCSQKLTASKVT